MLKRKPRIGPPAWYAAAAVGAVFAATVALVLGLRAPSDIAPAVVLASRTVAPSRSIPREEMPAATVAERVARSCVGADCPPVPAPVHLGAPAETDLMAAYQPADPDAWALDPRPLGTSSAGTPVPWTALRNTPWAALPADPTDAEAEGDDAQGGGFEE